MKQTIFMLRYRFSSALINLGLLVMPESAYKTELLRRLWELRVDVETAVDNYLNSEENKNDFQ